MKNKMRKDEQEKKRQARETHRKRWVYLVIVGVTIAGAGWLVIPALWPEKSSAVGGYLVELKGTMGGFSTSEIRAKAGRPLTVRLTSVDNRFHTDGGGKHQFAIDALGVNIIAPPLGTREATFTPKEPGVYEYYCDICCGGRANPTMVGKLIVEA